MSLPMVVAQKIFTAGVCRDRIAGQSQDCGRATAPLEGSPGLRTRSWASSKGGRGQTRNLKGGRLFRSVASVDLFWNKDFILILLSRIWFSALRAEPWRLKGPCRDWNRENRMLEMVQAGEVKSKLGTNLCTRVVHHLWGRRRPPGWLWNHQAPGQRRNHLPPQLLTEF